MFILGNNEEMKEKCLSSESKCYSIVKEIIKRVTSFSKNLYVSIDGDCTSTDKQTISSYSEFLITYSQVRLSNKPIRVCLEYSIDDTLYSANIVKLGDCLKEASEIYRLKHNNKTVMRLCARDKNNIFIVCLDRAKEQSEEYLMILANSKRKALAETSNLSTRTRSITSASSKKLLGCETKKKIDLEKEEIRSKVTEKILIDKNRKLDQLNSLLSNRDIEIQELKHKVKKLEGKVGSIEEDNSRMDKERNSKCNQYQQMVEQLEH